jgi:hypothetical protein
MEHEHRTGPTDRASATANWVLIGFIAIAAYFLFTEHRAHLWGALPYLLLLACPLLHLFHHGAHGSTHDTDDTQSRRDIPEKHRGH